MPEPLNVEDLIRLADSLERDVAFANTRVRVQNRRALRRRMTEVAIAGISEKLEYKTAGLEVNEDRYANRLRSASIKILVASRKQQSISVEKAQNIENFFYRIYYDLRRKRTSRIRAPDDRAIRYQVSDFVGIRHIDWAPHVREKLFGKLGGKIEDLPGKLKVLFKGGFEGNPFELRAPDPLRVFWNDDMSMVAEIGRVGIDQLRVSYGLSDNTDFASITSDLKSKHPQEAEPTTVSFYHVETNGHVYEAIANDRDTGGGGSRKTLLLRVSPNPAGRPRYTFAPGHEGTGDEPWQYFRPLLAPLYPLAELLNITGTLMTSSALKTGRAPYQEVKVGSGADDFGSILSRPENERNIIWLDTSTDTWPTARDGYEWKPVPSPDMDMLLATHQHLLAEFNDSGFPSILSPGASIDASSGYDRAQQMEGAQDFLEPPLTNIAAAWYEHFLQIAEQIKAVDLSVTIPVMQVAQGEDARVRPFVTIEPEDLEDIDLEVRFESVPRVVQFAEDESDRRDVELGFMARGTYMAKKYDDPIREARQVDLDKVGLAAAEAANEFAIQFIKQMAPQIAQGVAQDLGLPATVQEGQQGARPARPEGGSFPGLGVTSTPGVQAQGGAPPAVGGAARGAAQ